MHYRGFYIASDYRLTSQNPCQGHSLAKGQASSSKLEDVLAYQEPDVVCRIKEELGLDERKAQELFLDLKKYLWLAAGAQISTIPPTPIDKAWHEFIVFTREYDKFCYDMFGRFLHHEPHRGNSAAGSEVLYPTIDLVIEKFGGVPSENWQYTHI